MLPASTSGAAPAIARGASGPSPVLSRRRSRALSAIALAASLGAAACVPQRTVIPPGVDSPFTGYSSATYGADAMWLCRPDLPSNPCAADLTATEIRPDGSRAIVPHVPAKDPAVDCFYIYPTVDEDPRPGNHTDFRDRGPMLRVALSQAARFQEVCRLYVPLYRQITAGTYASSAWNLDERLKVAFSDVQDAFAHYLGQYNRGRKVVVIGHSQGADMTVRVLRRFFDRDPVLRPRLLAGMPIGGRVEVPPGARSGGTFATLPLCARADEIGCVIGYRSYPSGADVTGDPHGPPEGLVTGCVNPASVTENASAPLSRTFFPSVPAPWRGLRGIDGVETPFVLFRGFFAARCVPGPGGYDHLEITPASGVAASSLPIDLGAERFRNTLGLHALEMGLTQGDLIDLVARKAAAIAH
jgi:hypothetical protein